MKIALAGFKKEEEMSTQNSENYSSVEIKNPTNPKLDMPIEALLKELHSQLDLPTTRRLDQLLLRKYNWTIELSKVVPDHHHRKDYL